MHICRTRFKDIITEFVPPANKRSQKVIIFCAGVPGAPEKDDVLEFFSRKGYWAFFPRYRGTWESNGSFLAKSLERDVLDVINEFHTTFKDLWNGHRYRVRPKSITVVGSSFGGPAAILASRDPRVTKAICIAPVVDWKAENRAEPLEKLYRFLKEAYGDAYRVNKRHWNKLARGKFYNPAHHLKEIDGKKILVFHAEDDDIVKYPPVARFAKRVKAQLVTLKKGGHLSSHMLTSVRYYWKVRRFLSA